MTKIGIQKPKLIVTNDFQQFLAHFDWFLSLFEISDEKPELLPKMAILGLTLQPMGSIRPIQSCQCPETVLHCFDQ